MMTNDDQCINQPPMNLRDFHCHKRCESWFEWLAMAIHCHQWIVATNRATVEMGALTAVSWWPWLDRVTRLAEVGSCWRWSWSWAPSPTAATADIMLPTTGSRETCEPPTEISPGFNSPQSFPEKGTWVVCDFGSPIQWMFKHEWCTIQVYHWWSQWLRWFDAC